MKLKQVITELEELEKEYGDIDTQVVFDCEGRSYWGEIKLIYSTKYDNSDEPLILIDIG